PRLASFGRAADKALEIRCEHVLKCFGRLFARRSFVKRHIVGGRQRVNTLLAFFLIHRRFMHALAVHVELDASVRLIRNGDRFLRERDDGTGGMAAAMRRLARARRRRICHDDALPHHRTGSGLDVVDVEDRIVVGELFLENARRNIGRDLLRRDFVAQPELLLDGERIEPQRRAGGDRGRQCGEDQNGNSDGARGDARGAHCHHLVIAGEAAQSDQDPDQHAERNAQVQDREQLETDQLQRHVGAPGAYQEFKQRPYVLQENRKRRDDNRKKSTGQYFSKYVAAENPHFCESSGEDTVGSLGSSSSILVSSRSSISSEGASTVTAAVYPPPPTSAKGTPFSR